MKQIIIVFIALCFVSIMGAASYAYFVYIPDKVEKKIIESFNNFGFEELEIGKLERKSGQIILSQITLDKDKFSTIDQVNIEFSLTKFLISPYSAQNIIVSGMKLTGDLKDDNNLSISGWTNAQKILANLQNFPAGTITFEKSHLDLLTKSFGGIRIKFDAMVNMKSTGTVEFKANLKTKQKKLGLSSKIEGNISSKGSVSLTSDIEDISINLPNISIKRGLAKFKAVHDLNYKDTSTNLISGEIDLASLRWNDLPLSSVKGTVEYNFDYYKADISGSTFGTTPIKWKSLIENKSEVIFSETTIEPNKLEDVLTFLKQNKNLLLSKDIPKLILNTNQPVITIRNNYSRNPSKIVGDALIMVNHPKVSIKADYRTDKNGDVAGSIKLDKTPVKLHQVEIIQDEENPERKDNTRFDISAFGEFSVKNISSAPNIEWFVHTNILDGVLDYEVLELSKIKGSVFIGGNKNAKNKKVKPLPFKLPLKSSIPYSGKIRVNIDNKNRPILDKIALKIYGGKIITKYPILKDHTLAKKNSLTVSDINISDLINDAGFKNIFIQGKLGGVIPFEIKDGAMKVSGGILQSQNSGIIMLPEKMIAGLFPGNSRKMFNIRAALKNYHYEYFEIRLDGDLTDRVMMTLNARGRNPNIKNKESVDLNLQIETQISLLFKNLVRK